VNITAKQILVCHIGSVFLPGVARKVATRFYIHLWKVSKFVAAPNPGDVIDRRKSQSATLSGTCTAQPGPRGLLGVAVKNPNDKSKLSHVLVIRLRHGLSKRPGMDMLDGTEQI
jgi:hypothetical protein